MTSDVKIVYTETYKEYAKLKTEANDMVQMVYKVGQQLNQLPTNAVFLKPGAPPEAEGRTLFNPAEWPTSEKLQVLIKKWIDTKVALDKLWETIPESERPGLLPPPTLSLSQKVS